MSIIVIIKNDYRFLEFIKDFTIFTTSEWKISPILRTKDIIIKDHHYYNDNQYVFMELNNNNIPVHLIISKLLIWLHQFNLSFIVKTQDEYNLEKKFILEIIENVVVVAKKKKEKKNEIIILDDDDDIINIADQQHHIITPFLKREMIVDFKLYDIWMEGIIMSINGDRATITTQLDYTHKMKNINPIYSLSSSDISIRGKYTKEKEWFTINSYVDFYYKNSWEQGIIKHIILDDEEDSLVTINHKSKDIILTKKELYPSGIILPIKYINEEDKKNNPNENNNKKRITTNEEAIQFEIDNQEWFIFGRRVKYFFQNTWNIGILGNVPQGLGPKYRDVGDKDINEVYIININNIAPPPNNNDIHNNNNNPNNKVIQFEINDLIDFKIDHKWYVGKITNKVYDDEGNRNFLHFEVTKGGYKHISYKVYLLGSKINKYKYNKNQCSEISLLFELTHKVEYFSIIYNEWRIGIITGYNSESKKWNIEDLLEDIGIVKIPKELLAPLHTNISQTDIISIFCKVDNKIISSSSKTNNINTTDTTTTTTNNNINNNNNTHPCSPISIDCCICFDTITDSSNLVYLCSIKSHNICRTCLHNKLRHILEDVCKGVSSKILPINCFIYEDDSVTKKMKQCLNTIDFNVLNDAINTLPMNDNDNNNDNNDTPWCIIKESVYNKRLLPYLPPNLNVYLAPIVWVAIQCLNVDIIEDGGRGISVTNIDCPNEDCKANFVIDRAQNIAVVQNCPCCKINFCSGCNEIYNYYMEKYRSLDDNGISELNTNEMRKIWSKRHNMQCFNKEVHNKWIAEGRVMTLPDTLKPDSGLDLEKQLEIAYKYIELQCSSLAPRCPNCKVVGIKDEKCNAVICELNTDPEHNIIVDENDDDDDESDSDESNIELVIKDKKKKQVEQQPHQGCGTKWCWVCERVIYTNLHDYLLIRSSKDTSAGSRNALTAWLSYDGKGEKELDSNYNAAPINMVHTNHVSGYSLSHENKKALPHNFDPNALWTTEFGEIGAATEITKLPLQRLCPFVMKEVFVSYYDSNPTIKKYLSTTYKIDKNVIKECSKNEVKAMSLWFDIRIVEFLKRQIIPRFVKIGQKNLFYKAAKRLWMKNPNSYVMKLLDIPKDDQKLDTENSSKKRKKIENSIEILDSNDESDISEDSSSDSDVIVMNKKNINKVGKKKNKYVVKKKPKIAEKVKKKVIAK